MKRAMFVLICAALMLMVPQPAGAEENDKSPEQEGISQPEMVPFTFVFEDQKVPALADMESVRFVFDSGGKSAEKRDPSPRAHSQGGWSYMMTHFTSGRAWDMLMDLHLDTSDTGKSVQPLLNRILQAVKEYMELPQKEMITVYWGNIMYKCRLESPTVEYTMFTEDGTPVRAVANCVFKEYTPVEEQLKSAPRH